jgi:hypothetical protein
MLAPDGVALDYFESATSLLFQIGLPDQWVTIGNQETPVPNFVIDIIGNNSLECKSVFLYLCYQFKRQFFDVG